MKTIVKNSTQKIILICVAFLFLSCLNENVDGRSSALESLTQISSTEVMPERDVEGDTIKKVKRTDEEWRKRLTSEQYFVSREAGTEKPFTGKYWDNKRKGVYHCVGCDLVLFKSETKYRSGTGWPSFYKPIKANNIREVIDVSNGWKRVEVVCSRCDGHLGHVFEDGPMPTGLRYCLNSAALKFKEN